jgi:AcrR family transcriptional regulator
MSPRQAATRHDPTAERFLKAATQLMDAYLDDQPSQERPARLRSIHFPAALDWLRTEDVVRTAAAEGGAGASRKAFFNRWPTREEFLPDAVVYALVRDKVPEDPNEQAKQVPGTAAAPVPFSHEVVRIADGLLASLQRHPRSYLTLHIGPLLAQHPSLWEALKPAMDSGIQAWADGYAALLPDLGLVLRPGWTPYRLSLALQAALDGFLLRYRIMPEEYSTSRWEGVGIFADTVIALVLGVVDTDRSGISGSEALDKLLEPGT